MGLTDALSGNVAIVAGKPVPIVGFEKRRGTCQVLHGAVGIFRETLTLQSLLYISRGWVTS